MDAFVRRLLSDPELARMGHGQRAEQQDLGLGWLYYALARALRPRCAVVIGSYRGFVPAIIGKALLDAGDGGQLEFIDPSLVDHFWKDAQAVRAHFEALGAPNVSHHLCTTQEFAASEAFARLGEVGLLMVDGLHTAEQARFDYLAFLGRFANDAVTLFHDSVRRRWSGIYGADRRYEHTVCLLMDRLRGTAGLEVFSLPLADGVTLVRGRPQTLDLIQAPFA
jgi:hypothetical protein